MGSESIAEFVTTYGRSSLVRIRFAWNGEHGDAFEDANQALRSDVVAYACTHPDRAPDALLCDLLRAEAAWSREAWSAPATLPRLASIVLGRESPACFEAFLECFQASFDVLGACHHVTLEPARVEALLAETECRLARVADEGARDRLVAARSLFRKLHAGEAGTDWIATR